MAFGIYPVSHPVWFHVVLLVVAVPVFILGIAGNVTVLATVFRHPTLLGITSVFICQLALADLLNVMFCLPFTLPQIYYLGEWSLGVPMCKMVLFMQAVSAYTSAFTLTAMSCERYIAVVHPTTARAEWTRNRASLVAVLCALLAVILALPRPIFMDILKIPLNNNDSSVWEAVNNGNTSGIPFVEQCTERVPSLFVSVYGYFKFSVCYIGPLTGITIMYSLAISRIKNLEKPGSNLVPNRLYQKKKRAIRMLVAMTLSFAICWLPLNLLFLSQALPQGQELAMQSLTSLNMVVSLVSILKYIGCILNPILYVFMSSQYRRRLLFLAGWKRRSHISIQEIQAGRGSDFNGIENCTQIGYASHI